MTEKVSHFVDKSDITAMELARSPEPLTLIDRLGPLYNNEHLNASAGEQYSNKNFGRDSTISALFFLNILNYQTNKLEKQAVYEVVGNILQSLVRWQGQRGPNLDNLGRKNAEEPGKIHHESGPITIDTLGLVDKWRDPDDADSDNLVYYGSVDSTPLFVKAASAYIGNLRKVDPTGYSAYEYLVEKVPNYRGEQIRMCDAVVNALKWIEERMDSSELGMIEYYRLPGQEQGLRNQVWKDSLTSYVHQDGELANADKPIAPIEVQALTYDALTQAAKLFISDPILARTTGVGVEKIEKWHQLATQLQQTVLNHFWVEPDGRFASAIDRHPVTGQTRQVKTPSSDELHLLNSHIFDSLDGQLKERYITSLAKQALSPEFLTDLGIRCRSKAERQLINFADYHGSWVCWPWETHWIASGLRRQGLLEVADEIDTRIHNAFLIAGCYREFFLSDPASDICYYRYMPLEWATREKIKVDRITSTNIPDEPQAWSVAANEDIEAILSSKKNTESEPSPWVVNLDQKLLSSLQKTQLLTDDAKIIEARRQSPIAGIDRVGGKAADALYYHAAGLNPLTSPSAGT